MLTFVVIPCLNEAALIAQTIASLGFSADYQAPADTELIVVDNGSTDGTLTIVQKVQREALGPVHLVSEPIRGYVAPRRKGVAAAEALARTRGVDPSSVLILQADADTVYKHGYVAAMQAAAGVGLMLEGSTSRPLDFADAHPVYIAAERIVDDGTEPLMVADEDEVVVDDKICGYHLSDYLLWGGLFEEFTKAGDHIHAETTRMFIRAKLWHGAAKVRVNPAGAASSRRKIIENPWLHYATVGFPREATWVRKWAENTCCVSNVDAFANWVLHAKASNAVYLRRAHQLVLFRYLPAFVSSAVGQISSELPEDVTTLFAALPPRSRDAFAQAPGQMLIDLLELIDKCPALFA